MKVLVINHKVTGEVKALLIDTSVADMDAHLAAGYPDIDPADVEAREFTLNRAEDRGHITGVDIDTGTLIIEPYEVPEDEFKKLTLASLDPADVDAYIDNNVTDLASAKTVLKLYGKALIWTAKKNRMV